VANSPSFLGRRFGAASEYLLLLPAAFRPGVVAFDCGVPSTPILAVPKTDVVWLGVAGPFTDGDAVSDAV
jgi:hypothetical protein